MIVIDQLRLSDTTVISSRLSAMSWSGLFVTLKEVGYLWVSQAILQDAQRGAMDDEDTRISDTMMRFCFMEEQNNDSLAENHSGPISKAILKPIPLWDIDI